MSSRTARASTPQAAPTATSAGETAATHAAARIVEMKCVSMDFGANAVKNLQQLTNFA